MSRFISALDPSGIYLKFVHAAIKRETSDLPQILWVTDTSDERSKLDVRDARALTRLINIVFKEMGELYFPSRGPKQNKSGLIIKVIVHKGIDMTATGPGSLSDYLTTVTREHPDKSFIVISQNEVPVGLNALHLRYYPPKNWSWAPLLRHVGINAEGEDITHPYLENLRELKSVFIQGKLFAVSLADLL